MDENKIKKYHLHKDEPNNLQFEMFPLEDILIKEAPNTQKPHVHSFYQIIWFMKGNGKHYVDFDKYDIEDNTLFFISKGQIHHFDQHIQNGYIIHFNESFMDYNENFTDVFMKHNIFHSFEKEPLFKIKESNSNELLNIVKQMQAEIRTPNQFAHSDYLKAQLHLFLITIQRFGTRKNCEKLSMNKLSHILYIKFRRALEDHFYTTHTVAEYSKLLNISAKTLTNSTKGISHQTPL